MLIKLARNARELDEVFRVYFSDKPHLEILDTFQGKIMITGKDARKEKNRYCIIRDMLKIDNSATVPDNDNITYAIMHCNDSIFTKISIESIELINSFSNTWNVGVSNGYVKNTVSQDNCNVDFITFENNNSKKVYLHSLLMRNDMEKSNLSVDHINKDILDNRLSNLRLADQSMQNRNKSYHKFKDSKYYTDGPNGMESVPILPRFVSYCNEYKTNDDDTKKKIKEFLCIEHENCPLYGKKHLYKSASGMIKPMYEKYLDILTKMILWNIPIGFEIRNGDNITYTIKEVNELILEYNVKNNALVDIIDESEISVINSTINNIDNNTSSVKNAGNICISNNLNSNITVPKIQKAQKVNLKKQQLDEKIIKEKADVIDLLEKKYTNVEIQKKMSLSYHKVASIRREYLNVCVDVSETSEIIHSELAIPIPKAIAKKIPVRRTTTVDEVLYVLEQTVNGQFQAEILQHLNTERREKNAKLLSYDIIDHLKRSFSKKHAEGKRVISETETTRQNIEKYDRLVEQLLHAV